MTGRSRGLLMGAGVVVLAAALFLVIGGSRLVPMFTTAPVSQFRMGPVSGPVSQTIRTDGTPIGAIDVRITTTNGEAGRLALRILDDGDSLIRELVDTLPTGAYRCLASIRDRTVSDGCGKGREVRIVPPGGSV